MPPVPPPPTVPPREAHSLLHRWFFEYNPLYLVSALLVLAGVNLLLRGLAGRGDAVGYLGVTAIPELYVWALIGSAALLVRLRLRRPAVMLALLAMAYQCDPMLHTETCAHLGTLGAIATFVWIALFIAKLRALAWAMRLRLSTCATAIGIAGGLGLAAGPWILRALEAPLASAIVAAWLFAVFAAGSWSTRRISSLVALDGWGVVVAGRAFRATWIGWAAAVIVHVLFWRAQYPFALQLAVLVPVALLLATRLWEDEWSVWAWTAAALGIAVVWVPDHFALVACMGAATLGLRALRQPVVRRPAEDEPRATDPYRAGEPIISLPRQSPELAFVLATRSAMLRLFAGALGCLYLAAWSRTWMGGAWPEHTWWLDVLLLAITVVWAKTLRDHLPLLMPAATALHGAIEMQLVSAPSSMLQWGAACVALGFACLFTALAASVRWRHAARCSVTANATPLYADRPASAAVLSGP